MKVLLVNDHYDRAGGAETILHGTLDALEERGIENVVVHQHPTTQKETHRKLYRIPNLGQVGLLGKTPVTQDFQAVLEKEKPDLIHLHNVGNPEISEVSSRFAPTVQSVLEHSFYCPGGMKYLPVLRRVCPLAFGPMCLASAFLTHCNSVRPRNLFLSYLRSLRMMRAKRKILFLALSSYQAQCLIQSGYPAESVKVLPLFTCLPDLSKPALEPNGEPTVLFSGRAVSGKGLHLLLRALSGLKVPFRLVVDGVGPTLESAKVLALRLGLERRVEFVGWTESERHWAYFRQASVVVLPSIWPEPFGLVGIEAMSYAKPVVAFRVGGIPEWLEDGVTGFLVEAGDLRSFADRVSYLITHPRESAAMGEAGRKRVEELFTRSQYVGQLLAVYDELLGR